MNGRKVPADHVLRAIFRFGFNTASIAEVFEVSESAVSRHRHRLGFPPLMGGRRPVNGAASAHPYSPRFPEVRS